MTAVERTAFQMGVSGSLSVPQSRKYRRNRAVTGFLYCSHTSLTCILILTFERRNGKVRDGLLHAP